MSIALIGTLPELVLATERAGAGGLPIIASFPRPYSSHSNSGVIPRVPLFAKPMQMVKDIQGNLRPDREISTWLQGHGGASFDLIVSRFLRPAMLANAGSAPGIPVILDWDDVDYLKLGSQFAANPWPGFRGRMTMLLALSWMTRVCNTHLRRFAHVWLSSPAHRLALKPATYSMLPNIAWLQAQAPHLAKGITGNRFQLLFVGNLGYLPNAQALTRFISRIWPKIKMRVPLACLFVVGRLPSTGVPLEWNGQGVTLFGEVSALDVHYAGSTASVCPVDWGGGSNVKAIESLSYGVPCVGTPHTCEPFREDIREEDGLLCADTDDAFAEICTRLMIDPAYRKQLSEAALKAVERRYTAEAFDARVAIDVGRVLTTRQK